METARVNAPQKNSGPASAVNESVGSSQSAASSMQSSPLYAGPPALRLSSSSGGAAQGETLQPQIRSSLESSYRVDMSAVRVHTDAHSSAVADSLSARAFTYGPNIFLGSGERPSDLALMAHEGAHVVQQQSMPALQMSTGKSSTDTFEQEAHQASLAVQRGEQTIVTGRTNSPRIQREEKKSGGFFSKLGGLVSGGKDWLLGKAVEYARRIPGYDLLTVILGKDPITDKPVERNAINLIRGLLGLVPGGAAMFDNLQQSGALQKAFDWFNQEITKLNLTWETIKGLFRQFWDSLSASDILNPSGVLDRMKAIFGPPLGRLINFALSAGKKILELIFEGVLSLAGSLGKQILGIIRKAQNVFSLIINDPIGFLKNLIQAVKGGFLNFSANILTHLKNALFQWLFGALQGAGLTLPDKFDLRGILSIVLQVLGLTYARMREKLVKLIGEPAVAFIEKAFEFLKIIVTQGIAAAWQKVLEFATGLFDTVVEGIRNWVITAIVKAAISKLVTMFNPVGAIIQGIITIYNTVAFFIERAKQIAALAEAVFDSIANIASGNLGAAMDYVEKTMARALVVIISFLARLIGLGGISDTIKKIIQKIQSVVDKAIDKVVNFVVDKAKGLFAKVTGKGKERTEEQKQQDLNKATGEAKRAMDKFGGKRIGIVILKPILFAIKVRYGLQLLEPIKQGNHWAIHGQINPEKTVPTTVETADGSELAPIHVKAETEPNPTASPPAAPAASSSSDIGESVRVDPALRQELKKFWEDKKKADPSKAKTYDERIARLAASSRPTWRQSEEEMLFLRTKYAGLAGSEQVSFRRLQIVKGSPKGSTRPDIVHPRGYSIEVKNYQIKNFDNMITKLKKQIDDRRKHLPYDQHKLQAIIVDVRGQTISRDQVIDIKTRIQKATDLPIENIDVVTY